MKIDWIQLIASVLVCEIAGIIGSVFTISSIPNWYAALQKPWFNPPNWVFGPVWTILYALMGIALYWVWMQRKEKKTDLAIAVFGIQLALNTIWSILFFGLKDLFLAWIEILFLWLSILSAIVLFYPISKKAAIALVPYLLWVSFAALLNYSVWQLNA